MQGSLESKVALVTRVNCAPLRRQAYILSCSQLHERSPAFRSSMQSTAQAAANGLALIMGLLGWPNKLSQPTEKDARPNARVGMDGCPTPRILSLYPCIRLRFPVGEYVLHRHKMKEPSERQTGLPMADL